ncbi:hypothetical protein OC834_002944 [Tilletia horrida]|nr:hypothetical protein OC834_002944 [Tilletia horrida]
MTAVLQRYDPSLFQKLPSIEDAAGTFKAYGGIDKIEAAFAAIVKKHASASHFGLQLLHRHSSLAKDEIMLAHGHTTVPIKRADLSEAGLANVFATVWGLRPDSDEFAPLEFAFVEDGATPIPSLDLDLASDIAKIIKEHNLENTIGLAVIDHDLELGLETTHGRANVIVPAALMAVSDRFTEVVWHLTALGQPKQVKKRCRVICWMDDRGTHHPNAHKYEG